MKIYNHDNETQRNNRGTARRLLKAATVQQMAAGDWEIVTPEAAGCTLQVMRYEGYRRTLIVRQSDGRSSELELTDEALALAEGLVEKLREAYKA